MAVTLDLKRLEQRLPHTANWRDIATVAGEVAPTMDVPSYGHLIALIAGAIEVMPSNEIPQDLHEYLLLLNGKKAIRCAHQLITEYGVREAESLWTGCDRMMTQHKASILAFVRRSNAPIHTYSHRGVELCGSDTVDIAYLLTQWANAFSTPIDRRVFSDNLLNWACRVQLLASDAKNTSPPTVWMPPVGKLYISASQHFDPATDLPPEVTWHIVQGMIGTSETVGLSLAMHKGWVSFGCQPLGNRLHAPSDLLSIEKILIHLASHGYIWFQSSGAIWNIQVRHDHTRGEYQTSLAKAYLSR